ncbi:MAG: hypothetical protein KDI38_22430 [Calditrichaeota bacterium]|nr:hypothetical protein [Calditrichota bacterium]
MDILTQQLPHADLVRYLSGARDESLRQKVAQLRSEHPEFAMLLEMAEKAASDSPGDTPPPTVQLTIMQINRLLQDIYAGSADPDRRMLFRTHLLSSPQFYRRLLDHFADLHQTAAEAEALQASGVMIGSKTNQEILHELGIEKPQTAPRRAERPGEGLLGAVQAFFTSQFGRYAIPALASLAVLFMVGLPLYSSLTNPYNRLHWDEQAPLAQLNPERWAQDSAPATRHGAVPGSDSLNLASFRAGSERLAGVMKLMLPAFREKDYRNVLDKYRRTFPGAEALAQWLQKHDTAPAGDDSLLQQEIAGTQQLLQDYYFLSGAAALARYRTRSEALDQAARDSALATAVTNLTHAKTLGERHQLPDSDRIHYFLGLALAYQFHNAEAIREYRLIRPESDYYQSAQELMEYLQ